MRKKYEIHIISHTHWDREWYLPFQEFRLKLVELIDNLLEIFEQDKHFKYFLLDGQAIILEDYLEIRPEQKDNLQFLIKNKKIFVGPWYVLPDEFLVSPESLIRNLQLGFKIAGDFGNVMKAGYLPDSFGHISQMPQILRGFGINNFIFMRGIGGAQKGIKSELIWKGSDGSEVFALFLPMSYCHASLLPSNSISALEKITKLKNELAKYATTKYLVFMNGCDHLQAQPDLPDIIKEANKELQDSVLIHSNLPVFMEKVESACKNPSVYKGELRIFKAHDEQAWLLPGVFSSRVKLKQENFKCQELLEKWAEPLSSLNWLYGVDYKKELIRQAWKYLLQNHPHDSICGCSVDSVHRQMLTRFEWCRDLAGKIVADSVENLCSLIDTSFLKGNEKAFVVFNTLGFDRTDIVEGDVDIDFNQDFGFSIIDVKGIDIPYHVEKVEETEIRTASVSSSKTKVRRYSISFLAKDVPAFGYKLYKIKFCTEKPDEYSTSLSVKDRIIENKYFIVEIKRNGSLEIIDKNTGHIYDNCLIFEDSADIGDEYNYSPVLNNKAITTRNVKAEIRKIYRNSNLVKYSIELYMDIPSFSDGKGRSEKCISHKIVSYLTLTEESKRIDIETLIENKSKDHRLRVLFDSGANLAEYSEAESHFDVVKREIKIPEDHGYSESPCPTHHLQNFVDVNNGKRGLMIATRGIHEYEVFDNKERTIALTLLRSVGWLSRNDLLTRKGNAGPVIPTPEAQCRGEYKFNYSIIPHAYNWEISEAYTEAYKFSFKMKLAATDSHGGMILSPFRSFIRIYNVKIILNCVKKSERDESLIVRFFNISDSNVSGRIHLLFPIREIRLVDLNENPINNKKIQFVLNEIKLKFKPKQIQTLSVKI